MLIDSGKALADVIDDLPDPPAIAMVHDPKQAGPLDGHVPLVLAGHTHARKVSVLDDGTRLMVEGSTGGAGLRGLQGEEPTPLSLHRPLPRPRHRCAAGLRRDHPGRSRGDRGDHPADRRAPGTTGTPGADGAPASPTG